METHDVAQSCRRLAGLVVALVAVALLAGCGTTTRLDQLGAKPAGAGYRCANRVRDYLSEAGREHRKVGTGGDQDPAILVQINGPYRICEAGSAGTVASMADYLGDRFFLHGPSLGLPAGSG